MSNMLKCPNPTCPYVFDPSQVPVGVVLSCPRCGMQFTLGPPAPAAGAAPPPGFPAAPPGYPSGHGATAATAAPPQPPANAEFEAVGRSAIEERDPDAPRPGRRTGRYQVFILAGIAAVLMAGTALMIIAKLTYRPETVSADTVAKLHDLNIGVDTPPTGWTRDDTMKVKIGSPYIISYKREGPEAYMAFGAAEAPKGRAPRPSDMRTDLMQAFPKLFVREKDNDAFREEVAPETKWLGEPIAATHGFKFRALSGDGLVWMGEAYAVAHKGVAYYWMSWCGENDYEGMKAEFAAFRGRFKLLDARPDWKETQSNIIDFKGDTYKYTISDAEELWKEVLGAEFKALQTAEPDLDKRLRIYITPKRDRKARPDEAELSVYIFDGAGDPLQAAHRFAEEKETMRIRQANPDFAPPTFKEITDPPQGDPSPTTVPATSPVVRFKSNIVESRDSARLIVVSGLKVGDKIVVVHCWCELGKRDVFETKFVQIASSLR